MTIPMQDAVTVELIAIAEPDGGYALDWRPVDTSLMEAHSADFQQKLYEAYRTDPDTALFFLGLGDGTAEISDSVAFLHRVASAFINIWIYCAKRRRPFRKTGNGRLIGCGAVYEWRRASGRRLAGARLGEVETSIQPRNQGLSKKRFTEFFLGKNPKLHFAGRVS